jgi:general secretion pathway protein D
MNQSGLQKTIAYLTCLMLIMITSASFAQSGSEKTSTTSEQSKQFVSIDFNNVDINVFIKFISELTGKNFVVDQSVKGKVTIISPAKISIAEAFRVFESVLEVHGYTTVTAGKITKIIPSPDARAKNVKTLLSEEAGSPRDQVVTQLVPLRYADPTDIKKLFAPLISKNSVILAYNPTNTLIITDIHSNIKRLMGILKTIDVAGIGREISVIPLEFADASKFVKLLQSVFKTPKKPKKGDVASAVEFVADERTNTIVLLASEDDTGRIKKLIGMLDKEVPRGEEKIRVYYLENATAEELAKVLQSLSSKPTVRAKGAKRAPVVSESVQITADKATNSLIIMADKDDYVVLEEIIKKLDIPRAMVYIEALIMEVNVDKDFRLGVEWLGGSGVTYDGKDGVVGGGFSGGAFGGDPGYTTLQSGAGTASIGGIEIPIPVPVPLPSGFSMGIFSESQLTIGGVSFPNIGAVLQAYKKDKDVHILSTPQILTTDNQEAKIHVGKNLPFQTGTTTSTTSTFSSIEYKDVGKTLKITPQISKDRMVRLDISLEVTDLESTTDFRPTTLKRTVETTVIVKDNHTVVIGGLIDDSISTIEYKVPCLGEIPILGALFSSMSDASNKTNLYIFLTPRVLKTPAEATDLYEQKKVQIDAIKEGAIKIYKELPSERDQSNP